MFLAHNRRKTLCATLMLAVAAFALVSPVSPVYGQRDDQSRVYANVSVASLDALGRLALELGLPLPPGIAADTLKSQFDFLGDGLRTDMPMGAFFVAGPAVRADSQQSMVFALPVKPGTVKLSDYKAAGGKRVVGARGTILINGNLAKLTQRYLFIGGTQQTIARFSDAGVMTPYRAKGALARARIDLAAMRKAAPFQLNSLLGGLGDNQDPAGAVLLKALTSPIRQTIKSVDVQVDHTKTDMSVTMKFDGPQPWKMAGFGKPKLPGAAVASVDIVYPDSQRSLWAVDLLQQMLAAAGGPSGATTEQADSIYALLSEGARLFTAADALSLAITEVDGKLVGYVVQQHRTPIKLKERIAAMVKQANSLVGQGTEETRFLVDVTYKAKSGEEVTRLHFLLGGEPLVYVDMVQNGKTVVMTITQDDARHIEEILPVKMVGRMTTGVNGSIDLSRFIKASQHVRPGTVAKAQADQVTRIADLVKDQKLTFKASFEKKLLVVKVSIPKKIVPAAVQLFVLTNPLGQ